MMNLIKPFLFLFVLFIAISVNFAQQSTYKDITKVENFTLKDYNGNEHSLSDYNENKAIVIMFVSTECPVSNAYNVRMEKVYEDYKDKNIAFIGINSNKQENAESIKKHANAHFLNFPILKDIDNNIADKFHASVTPEVYVLNKNFEVLYHGRIDDSRKEESITKKDLRIALDEILEGKEVQNKRTKAFGCTIKRISK